MVGVSAAIAPDRALNRDDLAVACRAPPRMDRDRVALMMAANRFLAAPDDLDRAAQFPHRQRQDNLYGHILAPAERPAYRRVDHAHLIVRQVQRWRHLLPIFAAPLARPNDSP